MINKKFIPFYLIGLYPFTLILGTLISESLSIILILLFAVESIKNKKLNFYKDLIIYFLVIIWIFMMINLFNSIDFQLSFNRSIFFIRYPLLILSITYFLRKDPDKIEIIFKLWMLTVVVTIIDLYIQFFFGANILGYQSPWEERLSGFFNQELKVAHLLIGFFLPAFAYFFQKKPKNIFLYILLILYFLILILTNERANIIRGSLALVIFFTLIPYFKVKIKTILISSILAIFCVMLFFVEPVKNRFIKEISFMDADRSLINYVILSNYGPHYLTSLEIFKKNKLFGTGIKTFRKSCKNVSIKKYYNDDSHLSNSGCSTHPHQYYFEILSDQGLLGFIIFVSFFIYLSLRIIKRFFISKNSVFFATGSFLLVQLIPILPTGSFFTSFGSTIFFINLSLIFYYLKQNE